MKKVMLIVLALFVAPAMAGVTITVVPSETEALTATIEYAVDGDQADGFDGSKVAGIALDVSVSAGIIETVVPAKIGISELNSEGYGIFMSTIIIEDGEIKDSSPAAIGAPDYPGQPGTDASCVLEFGALWDQRPPEAEKTPPLASGVLCTITVSEACTVTIGGNATRGKAVMIGGASIADADIEYVDGDIGPGGPDCYKGPDQEAWEEAGFPESWCTPYQCYGDADGEMEILIETPTFTLYTPIGTNDVAALIACYRKPLGDAAENVACDFDHLKEILIETPTFTLYTRVGAGDVATLISYYRKPSTDPSIATSCSP